MSKPFKETVEERAKRDPEFKQTLEEEMSRTIYLHLEPHDISPESGATVQVKLDDEGIVIDAWSLDDCIASTWKTYNELGIEVKEVKDE